MILLGWPNGCLGSRIGHGSTTKKSVLVGVLGSLRTATLGTKVIKADENRLGLALTRIEVPSTLSLFGFRLPCGAVVFTSWLFAWLALNVCACRGIGESAVLENCIFPWLC